MTRKFFPWFMPPPPPLPLKKSSARVKPRPTPVPGRQSPLTLPPPSTGPSTSRRPSPTQTSICTLSSPSLHGSQGGHRGSLGLLTVTTEDMVPCLPVTDAEQNFRAYHG